MELAALSLCFLGSSREESPVPSARITCLGGEGIKVTQCTAEFSEGDEVEGNGHLVFIKKNISQNPAAESNCQAARPPRALATLASERPPKSRPFLGEAQEPAESSWELCFTSHLGRSTQDSSGINRQPCTCRSMTWDPHKPEWGRIQLFIR